MIGRCVFGCALVSVLLSVPACTDSINRSPFVPAAVGSDVQQSSASSVVRVLGGNISTSEIRLQYIFDDRSLDVTFSIADTAVALQTVHVTAAPLPARPLAVNEVVFGGLLPSHAYLISCQGLRQGETVCSFTLDTLRTVP